jgi:trimeric autotransporter adhesin
VAARLRRAVTVVPDYPRSFLRNAWVRRVLPTGVVAAIVVAGTVVTRANANASPNDIFRTTTVTTGSVQQRLNVTGSVQRVKQVSESFAVAGTLSSVSVAVGDKVASGQRLATLDPAPLRSAVTVARASLAKAKATLESDESATTDTATATTQAQTSTPAVTANASATSTPAADPVAASSTGQSAKSANQRLAAAQQRVTIAQNTVVADLGRATSALEQCSSFFPSESRSNPTPSDSPTSSPTTAPEATGTRPASGSSTHSPAAAAAPTTTPSPTPTSSAALKACLGALRGVPTQQQIQRDQQDLKSSQAALTKAFTALIATAGNTSTLPATSSRTGSTNQSTVQSTNQSTSSQPASTQSTKQTAGGQSTSQSPNSQSSGAQTGATGQSSAARLVSDRAAVTNAESVLAGAIKNQASAILKSSTAGTVGSVGFVKGTSSTGKSIVVVGAGAVDVTVNVPLASIASVHVRQEAEVTPQGAAASVPGAVTSISLLPAATSTATSGGTGTSQGTATTSSPTYPVVIRVPDTGAALASGSRAEVSLLIGTADNVLTVPNSALMPLAKGQALASTLKNGVATRVRVQTGYVGTLTTQVTSGLTAGQQVVLADLSTALPTNTTNSRRFGFGAGGAGGIAGAGLGGGGSGFASSR